MSSDGTLRTVRQHLAAAIKPHVPSRWKTFTTLTAFKKLAVPAVYFEFTDIANEMAGKPLAAGHVAANFEVAIVLPGSLTEIQENNADAAVLHLVHALDNADGLFWGPTARKVVLDTGFLGWIVPVSVLTSSLPDPAN